MTIHTAPPTVATEPSRPALLRAAGAGSLVGGLGHGTFAIAGIATAGALAPIQNWEFAADAVGDFRWAGLLFSFITIAWAAGYAFAMLALGRLVWPATSSGGALAKAAAVATGALIALGGGIGLAQYSGATIDMVESGADIPAQQAAMQATWVVLHGCWYAVGWIVATWIVAFSIAAYRARLFRVLGLVLALLAATTAYATLVFTPYPTSLPFVSLYIVVLGIVLLVRARRAARAADPAVARA